MNIDVSVLLAYDVMSLDNLFPKLSEFFNISTLEDGPIILSQNVRNQYSLMQHHISKEQTFNHTTAKP
jgi:phosphatidate phosphatase APP1